MTIYPEYCALLVVFIVCIVIVVKEVVRHWSVDSELREAIHDWEDDECHRYDVCKDCSRYNEYEDECRRSSPCIKWKDWKAKELGIKEKETKEIKNIKSKKKMKIPKIYRIILWGIVVKLLWNLTSLLINYLETLV